VVPVYDKATVGALVDPYRKGHLLDMPTTGAALTRVYRVDNLAGFPMGEFTSRGEKPEGVAPPPLPPKAATR